ncbi:hypothetical protein HB852_02675 [Listeria grandensis]|uniref:Mga helix-turn-helix domain-containing protein n=1 Tax=Listeria grandensis TaxID=1494963 RepID=A0A7X0Y2K4_9LIST|nr:helix-turn-helix domain-containing protein [Listeria grandensis]MBC1473527.1 hypothetical protein [Listeria grandensis]MBC1935553.1 hypothetical protein [Listeria grandensis]
MNKLYLDLLTDKKNKRLVILLDYLVKSRHPSTIEELADVVNVSIKTLKKDLEILEDVFPEGVWLANIGNKSVLLEWQAAFSISDFIQSFIGNSPLFQILDAMFRGEHFSVAQWSEKLWISEMTLRRYTNTLVKIIKPYKLDLETAPLQLAGKESDIRCFYFSYLNQRKQTDVLSASVEEKKVISHFYKKMLEKAEKRLDRVLHLDYHRMVSWLGVITQRLENSNYIKLSEALKDEISEESSYQIFRQLYEDELMVNFEFGSIPEDEMIYAYIICLDSVVYKLNDGKHFQMRGEDRCIEIYEDLFAWRHLQHLGIPATKLEHAHASFIAFTENLTLLTQISEVFQKNSYELNVYTKSEYPYTYRYWLDQLTQNEHVKDLPIAYREDVAVSLTMLTCAYRGEENYRNKTILFAFSGESTYMNYLMTRVRQHIPHGVKYDFLFNEEITEEAIRERDVDIFLHNYDIEGNMNNCLSLRISPFPTVRELEFINKLIVDMPSDIMHMTYDAYSENLITG